MEIKNSTTIKQFELIGNFPKGQDYIDAGLAKEALIMTSLIQEKNSMNDITGFLFAFGDGKLIFSKHGSVLDLLKNLELKSKCVIGVNSELHFNHLVDIDLRMIKGFVCPDVYEKELVKNHILKTLPKQNKKIFVLTNKIVSRQRENVIHLFNENIDKIKVLDMQTGTKDNISQVMETVTSSFF